MIKSLRSYLQYTDNNFQAQNTIWLLMSDFDYYIELKVVYIY